MLLREELVERLKHYVVELTFTKKDGTRRKMRCTLNSGLIQEYEKKTGRVKPFNEAVLPVWDVEKKEWRSINVNTIEYPITIYAYAARY